ncbi:hypothetical protein [Streptomyces filamentosus]|uniref:hypothetical protein n=1 Tax=Streptomyces filamentosus TaxID=67294 RepID=UPI0037D310E0
MQSNTARTAAMIQITPKWSVPRDRFMEWYQGTRPLPGMDAGLFFNEGVQCGLLTRRKAVELHERHDALTRQEEAAERGELVCRTCAGAPPSGFTCQTCKADGPST